MPTASRRLKSLPKCSSMFGLGRKKRAPGGATAKGFTSRDAAYAAWEDDPERFWMERAGALAWMGEPRQALAQMEPLPVRFPGGVMNTAQACLDHHCENGRGEQPALIHDSAMTGEIRRFTYAELLEAVTRFAGALARSGVSKGDRVIIYMPMVPEAVIAMLACARLGAVHSVVFGGFAAKELASRIDDAEPKLILTASCGLEPGRTVDFKALLDSALDQATHAPEACVVVQRPQAPCALVEGRDIDWQLFVEGADPCPPIAMKAGEALYILYTSGTTGRPKGVVRDNAGHAVALRWAMEAVYDARPGDVFWAASDIGWVVGHSFIVYAPLLTGCTTILYEGKPVGTPDAGAFWRVISQHKVTTLFTAPTAIRAIKGADPEAKLLAGHDISSLRALFLAGERADPDTIRWAEKVLARPVIDNWWQTELGWPALATCLGLGDTATRIGSAGKPVPGYRFRVVDEDNHDLPAGEIGRLVIDRPLPPGTLLGLWKNEAGLRQAYLDPVPGAYLTGDAGMIDKDGFVHVMSRIDDVLNVAGHRLSSGAIEEIVANHKDVAECAVVGAADALKGQVPVALVVLNAGAGRNFDELADEIIRDVREQIGPVAAMKSVIVVDKLPKTRSGKILRGTMRQLANGEQPPTPATIDDASALEDVARALAARLNRNQTKAG